MHIEFLVEEESTERALKILVPAILASATSEFVIHSHQGKKDLLRKLPDRLRGYKKWIPADWRIVVLVDEDRQDCHALKAELEHTARSAGFHTRSIVSPPQPYQVLNRIAIEELEAWFFGDIEAIVAAYPKIDSNLGRKKPYRDPDAIQGGTWEALERELQNKGYHPGGLEKLKAAEDIVRHMQPPRNRSGSFQCFRDGLREIVEYEGER